MSLFAWTRFFRRPVADEVLSAQARGDVGRDSGNWQAAAEGYAEHLALHPDDFSIWVQLGHSLKEAGRRAEALDAYRSALDLDADDADLLLNLGHFYLQEGFLADARDAFRRSFAADGNADAETHYNELVQRANIDLLASSPLFDRAWYLDRYPDVAQSGIDPALHYLSAGGIEGRDPGPLFSSTCYWRENEDVRSTGANPLIHYLGWGEREERLIFASLTPDERANAGLVALHALFDPSYYTEMFPDAARYANPAEHFIATSRSRIVDPGPGFSSSWYARVNRDVAGSRLPPFVHYILVGEADGRLPMPVRPSFEALHLPSRAIAGKAALASSTHIDRERIAWPPLDDLDGALVVAGASLGTVPRRRSALRAIALFARLHGWTLPDIGVTADGPVKPGDAAILSAPDMGFVDGWMVDTHAIRLRADLADKAGPLRIQAWQAVSGALTLCGDAAATPAFPLFVDIRTANPFCPVLLVITGTDGAIRHSALMPFPSLLRGGRHHAEAIAAARGADHFVEVQRGSARLLDALFAVDTTRPAPIFAIDSDGATGAEPAFSPDVREWLGTIMGVGFDDATPPDSGGRPVIRLPADCLPTIAAIVSPIAPAPGDARIGGLILADRIDSSPICEIGIPAVSGTGLATVAGSSHRFPSISGGTSPVPVAIRYTHGRQSAAQLLISSPEDGDAAILASADRITVAIAYRDIRNLRRLLLSLSEQSAASRFDIAIVAVPADDDEAEAIAAAGRGTFAGRISLHPDHGALGGQDVLLLADHVVLQDPRSVLALLALASLPSVASAACVQIDRNLESGSVSIASSGLFLDGGAATTSRLTSPRIDLFPGSIYPVACPDFALALIPGHAWDAFGKAAMTLPVGERAQAFAIGAIKAGLRHLCTSRVGAYVPARESGDIRPARKAGQWRAIAGDVPQIRSLLR